MITYLSRLSSLLILLLLTTPSHAAMPGDGRRGSGTTATASPFRPDGTMIIPRDSTDGTMIIPHFPGIILRLHMVRHGETEANKANYVLGQRESPLTTKGINQAAALGTFLGGDGRRRRQTFWKAYASDYDRTLKTARLILGEEGEGEPSCSSGSDDRYGKSQEQGDQNDNGATESSAKVATMVDDRHEALVPPVIQDKRLRERAKGVREGRPKTVTYGEAVKLHHSENGQDAPLPLLESDDDVWSRVKDWIDEVASEACRTADEDDGIPSYQELLDSEDIPTASTITDSKGNEYQRSAYAMDTEALGSAVDPRNQSRRRDVLVVSHSATIRTAVNRLVGDQLPSNVVRGSGGDDGAAQGMLVVPNTSRTIVDIAVTPPETDTGDPPKWSAELVDLTNTDHLKEM